MGHNPDMHHTETSPVSSDMLPETDADLYDAASESLTDQDIDLIMRTSQKLLSDGDLDEALFGLRKILQGSPDYTLAYGLLGEILAQQKKYLAAQHALTRVLSGLSQQDPLRGKYHLELSYCLYQLGDYQKAAIEAFKAVDLLPEDAHSHARLAFCLQKMGLAAEALICTQNSLNLLEKQPLEADCDLFQALYRCQAYANLQQGFLSTGFKNLSHARMMDHSDVTDHSNSLTQHRFQDKIVSVCLSGDHGENILLARYLDLLKSAGALITIESPPHLQRLFEQLNIVEDVQPISSKSEGIEHDVRLDLADLPYHLNISDDKILPPPCRFSMPVHQPHPGRILQVGIAWHSHHLHQFKSEKSAFFDEMISLLNIPHIKLHSLELAEHAKDLSHKGVHPMISDHGSKCHDAAELAEQILSLDLIISPDNDIAHLSASLGCPTWVLLSPDAHWAWGSGGMTNWYPKIRLFRATAPAQWRELFHRVHEALRLQAGEHFANEGAYEVATHNWSDRPEAEAKSPHPQQQFAAAPPEPELAELEIAEIEDGEAVEQSDVIESDPLLEADQEDLIDDLSTESNDAEIEIVESDDIPVMSAEEILSDQLETDITPDDDQIIIETSPVSPAEQESFIENKLAEILEDDASSEAIEEPGDELPDLEDISDIPDLDTAADTDLSPNINSETPIDAESEADTREIASEASAEDISVTEEPATSPEEIADIDDTDIPLSDQPSSDQNAEKDTSETAPVDVLSLPLAFTNEMGHPRLTLKVARDDLKDPDIITLCRQEADYGGYQYATRLFLEEHLLPGDVFIDVGAHWGIYSLTAASKYPGEIKVLAVEPHPQNLQKFTDLMPERLAEDIDLVATALADRAGTGLLSPGTSMSHYLVGMAESDLSPFVLDPPADMAIDPDDSLSCPVTTLDSLFAARPDLHGRRIFLKISANGVEPEILRGARNLLTSGRVAAILWQRGRAYDRTADRERLLGMMQELQALGYRHFRLPHDVLGGACVPFLYGPELCTVFSVAPDFPIQPAYARAPGKYVPPLRPSSNQLPDKVQGQWTELLKIAQTTDVGRWADPDVLKQGAEQRYNLLAQYVDPAQPLLDVGAGLMLLRQHMANPDLYTPLDLLQWDARTQIMDLNQGQYPQNAVAQIVISACLEYLHHPDQCLSQMADLSDRLYLIYDTAADGNRGERRQRGYMNDFSYDDLLALLQKTGWSLQDHHGLSQGTHLFICHKADV